ncbi:MAG: hypothetical protein ABI648_16350 [Betaproteobacteria bacterium]
MSVLLVSALLAPLGSFAADLEPESIFSLSGFGTAGLAHNSTDKAEFLRDFLQPRGVKNSSWSGDVDSRIGLQVNARATTEIEGMVQAVSYYDYAGNYNPELTWAFISYAPTADFKARVGRLGWDVYLLSDSRHVGYSYLWVRPPVDYFGQLQISHIDGADAVFKDELGGGIASVKLYGGKADQQIPSPPFADYNLNARVLGANLDFQKGNWQYRLGYTSINIKNELPAIAPLLSALRGTGSPQAAALADDISVAGKTLEIASVGAVFESGPWQAQLMFNRLTSHSLAYPQKDSGYFLLGYRIQQWTPYLTLSGVRSKSAQGQTGFPTPNPLDNAVSAALAATQSRQHTISLGTRYDFMRNADLKFQVDRVQVDNNATLLWRNAQPDWNGRATIVSLVLDFVF